MYTTKYGCKYSQFKMLKWSGSVGSNHTFCRTLPVFRLFPRFAFRIAMRKVFVELTFKSTMKKQKNQVA